jgi:hypothetical protein
MILVVVVVFGIEIDFAGVVGVVTGRGGRYCGFACGWACSYVEKIYISNQNQNGLKNNFISDDANQTTCGTVVGSKGEPPIPHSPHPWSQNRSILPTIPIFPY